MAISRTELEAEVTNLVSSARVYFDKCHAALGEKATDNLLMDQADYYWSDIPDPLRAEANDFRQRIISLTQRAMGLCRASLLVSDADLSEVKVIAKRLLALIRLRDYFYERPRVVQDEGAILGIQPGAQEERGPQPPRRAFRSFSREAESLSRIIDLTDNETSLAATTKGSEPNVSAYRQNSAFVMMWMDASKPELEDVRDAVVEVFRAFGIVAVRADDIEHEGSITEKVIGEIHTSEFLFADLSGSRPNVYYEIGYAHALGKRVILFRKQGTDMHFDLAGYNCPEYENIRDLKNKLTKRLESLTNRKSSTPLTDVANT
jgi:hypothetical protein